LKLKNLNSFSFLQKRWNTRLSGNQRIEGGGEYRKKRALWINPRTARFRAQRKKAHDYAIFEPELCRAREDHGAKKSAAACQSLRKPSEHASYQRMEYTVRGRGTDRHEGPLQIFEASRKPHIP